MSYTAHGSLFWSSQAGFPFSTSPQRRAVDGTPPARPNCSETDEKTIHTIDIYDLGSKNHYQKHRIQTQIKNQPSDPHGPNGRSRTQRTNKYLKTIPQIYQGTDRTQRIHRPQIYISNTRATPQKNRLNYKHRPQIYSKNTDQQTVFFIQINNP